MTPATTEVKRKTGDDSKAAAAGPLSAEELGKIDAYWKGNRNSTLDPAAADKGIADLVAWQVRNWGSEDDLTNQRIGELAAEYYGYQYVVVPISEEAMKRSNGRPSPLEVTYVSRTSGAWASSSWSHRIESSEKSRSFTHSPPLNQQAP